MCQRPNKSDFHKKVLFVLENELQGISFLHITHFVELHTEIFSLLRWTGKLKPHQ